MAGLERRQTHTNLCKVLHTLSHAQLLAEGITGAPLEATEMQRLYDDSEGSPLFVVEALKSEAPANAPKVQAVIAGRLARLSPPAAALAGTAAAIGRSCTPTVTPSGRGSAPWRCPMVFRSERDRPAPVAPAHRAAGAARGLGGLRLRADGAGADTDAWRCRHDDRTGTPM